MTAVDGGTYGLEAGFALCAFTGISFEQEGRIAADLSDPGKLRKDLHLLFTGTCGGAEEPLDPDDLRIVELLLFAGNADVSDFLQLGGKVLEDIFLSSSKDEGACQLFELFGGTLILLLCDRALIALFEFFGAVKETGHQEIEDAPEFGEAVLDRSPGKRETAVCFDGLDGLCRCRLCILDVLCLIQYNEVKFLILIQSNVPLQKIVGGHINVRAVCLLQRFFSCALRTGKCGAGKGRGETPDLLLPVIDQGRRTDDERGQCISLLFIVKDQGYHLDGLAKAHLICQDAAEAGILQSLQPFETMGLIRTQRSRQ